LTNLGLKDLQNLLIKAANKECFEDELKATTSFYGTDLESSSLQVQLETLSHQFSQHESGKANLQDIINYIKRFSIPERQICSQIVKIVKLILVNPSTNAVSERSFLPCEGSKHFCDRL